MGMTLMQHVLAEGRRLGATRATLEVRASNAAALRLYDRLGFYLAATRRNYYSNPVEDALILWRDESADARRSQPASLISSSWAFCILLLRNVNVRS